MYKLGWLYMESIVPGGNPQIWVLAEPEWIIATISAMKISTLINWTTWFQKNSENNYEKDLKVRIGIFSTSFFTNNLRFLYNDLNSCNHDFQ
jgi:hypothetical protein